MNHVSDIAARPLLIGGMHRSGTSLTASLVASAGIDLGPELLGGNASNPPGHFEDLGIQRFHERALLAQGVCSQGFTATACGAVPAALAPEADDLVAARTRSGAAWGWKEPRTTLFLDFWQQRLPDARHLFVYRRPWEVADSLFRRGDETFRLNPAFALAVWTHYNRLIVDFVHRHSDRCLVVDVAQVVADPDGVCAAVRSRLDVPLGSPARRYHERLLTRDDAAPRATIVREVAPEAWRTYLELRDLAGATDEQAETPHRGAALGECAVLEWARASRAESELRRLAADEARRRAEEDAARRAAEEEARHAAAEDRRRTAEEAPQRIELEWARRRRRSFTAAVRRAPGTVVAGIVAASRLLRPQPRPDAAGDVPDIRPFPRVDEAPATRRAA